MPKHTKKEKEKNRKRLEQQRQQSIPKDSPLLRQSSPKSTTAQEDTSKPEKREITQPEIIRDQETGKMTGIRTPDGRTLLGIDVETIKAIAGKYAEPTPPGAVEATEARQQQQQKERVEELLPIAESEGVFEERPERVELDVKQGEEAFLRKSSEPKFRPFKLFRLAGLIDDISDEEDKREIEGLIQNPETARELMINEIQKEVLNNERTSRQKLGSLLEPFLGDLKFADIDVERYADLIARMPSEEADTIVEQIKTLQGDISGMTDSVSQGEAGNPAEVLRELGNIEVEIAIYEASLKKLIIASNELQSNPEKINLIETQLLSVRRDLFEAKQRAAEGALITPTDSQLYLKLKEIKNENT